MIPNFKYASASWDDKFISYPINDHHSFSSCLDTEQFGCNCD